MIVPNANAAKLLTPTQIMEHNNNVVNIFRFDNIEEFKSKFPLSDGFMLNDDKFSAFSEIFSQNPCLLSVAAYFNAIKIGEFLFQSGASSSTVDLLFRTPVHFAGAGGSLDFIRLLESHHADLHTTDNRQRSYIHYAAENDRVEILKYAYVSGANLDEESSDGCPIHLACKSGAFLSIEFLTKTGKVDLNRQFRDRPPILHLLNSSCFEAIPILLKYGMNIDAPIVGKWTTLYYVIRTGSSHVVQLLLQFGASPNRCNNPNSWSPMHVAAQEHNEKIVEILYQHGSIIHCMSKANQSPFSLAFSPSNYEKGKAEYQTAKSIRKKEIDSLARAMILTLITGRIMEKTDEIVATSVKKYCEKHPDKIDD